MKDNHLLNPFGNPEGARADLDDVTKGFVDYGNEQLWKGLASTPDDLRGRVFVGKKGSGKTLYLRRSKDYVSNNTELFAGDLEIRPPSTNDVIRFSRYFERYELRENWELVWRRSILRSVTSYLLNSKQLSSQLPEVIKHSLRYDYTEVLRQIDPYDSAVGILSEASAILQIQGSNEIRRYLNNPSWAQFESKLQDALNHCMPLCLYIDGVDEHFGHAPMFWLECQIGLYRAIMGLLKEGALGGRLHIFAAIRDIVLIKVLQGVHSLRDFEDLHVRHLTWDYRSINLLLEEKIKRLNSVFFEKPKQDKTITNWLGIESIYNTHRNTEEPIVQYLLRHTRLLPRDIITLGNLLCQEIYRVRWMPEVYTFKEAIPRAVKFAAKRFCIEQIAICASQIATDFPPSKDDNKDYQRFVGSDEYHRNLADNIKDFIRGFRADRFNRKHFDLQCDKSIKIFGENSDILSILWLNGLLGYIDGSNVNNKVIFVSDENISEFKLPLNKKFYAFHSCVIDGVGLTSTGRPVIQW